jgi:hypothetical protein
MRRQAWLFAGAVLLPPLTTLRVIVVNVDPGAWTSLSPATLGALTADALLLTAGLIVVVAPLAGVFVGHASPGRAVSVLAVATVLFTSSSAAVTVATLGASGALGYVVSSHAALASVVFALSVFGASCAALLKDPLDAAALGLSIVLLAAGGVLVSGPVASSLPRALLEAGLVASPFVVAATAAGIDIARLDVFYQISPLAHMQIEYPSWPAVCGWYLAVTCCFFVGLTWQRRSGSAIAASREEWS